MIDRLPLNPSNIITLGRLLLVPLLFLLILSDGGAWPAGIVFAVAAVSDALDGHLARSREEITKFGTLMDPVADKLLVGAALVALVGVDRLAAWVAVAIVGRELAVSALRWVRGREGLIIAASPLGKLKMLLQVALVTALIAASDPGAGWLQALVYLTVLVTVVSGIHYFVSFRRALRGERAAPSPRARVSEAG